MQQQKSRAFYRIQATRMMIGAGNILKKHAADQARKVGLTLITTTCISLLKCLYFIYNSYFYYVIGREQP